MEGSQMTGTISGRRNENRTSFINTDLGWVERDLFQTLEASIQLGLFIQVAKLVR